MLEPLLSLYYFHLRNGTDVLLDAEGRELDAAAVAAAALGEARSIISHDALAGRILLDQHIDVENGAGETVHCLAFADAVKIVPAPR
jgi:hypothetical protein